MRLRKGISKQANVDEITKRYIKDNPGLKSTLEIFNVSKKEYQKTIEARSKRDVITLTNSTGRYDNGNVRGNTE
jgi:hypothetical protein